MLNFSVVSIMRDEILSLPRFVSDARPLMESGVKFLVVDTGSTDGSVEFARRHGIEVFEAGERFMRSVTKEEEVALSCLCAVDGLDCPLPDFKEGDRYFDFAAAKNFAAALSPTDWVLMPDIDEEAVIPDVSLVSSWLEDAELGLVRTRIKAESTVWTTARFYDQAKMEWRGATHEALYGKTGQAVKEATAKEGEVLLVHHQLPKESRPRRMTALIAQHLNDPSPRHAHYAGRELLWRGYPQLAESVLLRHAEGESWVQERCQSLVYAGDAQEAQGKDPTLTWIRAHSLCPTMSAPLARLARRAYNRADWPMVRVWSEALVSGGSQDLFTRDYITDENDLKLPWKYLVPSYWALGRRDWAADAYRNLRELLPNDPKVAEDERWFLHKQVTVVIPHMKDTREKELKRLKASIANQTYPAEINVIVEEDSMEDRKGCPRTFNSGVAKAETDLVMFIGDDCELQHDTIEEAVDALRPLDFKGLVQLNDGTGRDFPTGFIAHKSLLKDLYRNQFFAEDFYHNFCDCFLADQVKAMGRYVYAPEARFKHHHPTMVEGMAVDEVHELALFKPHFEADRATYGRLKEAMRPRVYDCFTFNGEGDLLRFRLETLKDKVDAFVIVEGDRTFTGIRKSLTAQDHIPEEFASRCHVVQVTDWPEGDAWAMERHQRNSIMHGLKDARPWDMVMISDVDEIPNPEVIKSYDQVMSLEQRMHYFHINNDQGYPWTKAKILPYRLMTTPEEVRLSSCPVIPNGGHHFSYLGSVDSIVRKIESFAHTEFDKPEFKDKEVLKARIERGEDVFGRWTGGRYVPVDASYPKTVSMLWNHFRPLDSYDPKDNKVEGWMTDEELAWLFRTAKENEFVLEVGCWKGRSTQALLCSGATVTVVDTFGGEADNYTREVAAREDIKAQFMANVGMYPNLANVLKMDSVEAASLPGVPSDFVFIDGEHSYEAARRDIMAWKDRCLSVLAGHDYTNSPGVKRAVDEILGGPDEVIGSIWVKRLQPLCKK